MPSPSKGASVPTARLIEVSHGAVMAGIRPSSYESHKPAFGQHHDRGTNPLSIFSRHGGFTNASRPSICRSADGERSNRIAPRFEEADASDIALSSDAPERAAKGAYESQLDPPNFFEHRR